MAGAELVVHRDQVNDRVRRSLYRHDVLSMSDRTA
jgi:hypothetical protein